LVSPKANPPLIPSPWTLIPILHVYKDSAKKHVVSRQKFSLLQKNAKKRKKLRAFARLYTSAQNNAKISTFPQNCAKNAHFHAKPPQIHAQRKEDPMLPQYPR